MSAVNDNFSVVWHDFNFFFISCIGIRVTYWFGARHIVLIRTKKRSLQKAWFFIEKFFKISNHVLKVNNKGCVIQKQYREINSLTLEPNSTVCLLLATFCRLKSFPSNIKRNIRKSHNNNNNNNNRSWKTNFSSIYAK